MAKIDRYNGNLQAFASAALGTERTIYGDVTQSNDLTDQFTAEFLRGWGNVGPSDEPTLQDFNAMGFTHGQLLAYLHQIGVPEYNAAQEYHIGSFTNSGGILYASLVNNNIGNAPASSPAEWQPYGQSVDTVNAAIATVAAAGTIDLTTGAPDTSQIAISGTGVNINGFTVAANRFFVVKMTGASNTLVNSASLVTGRGADIPVVAGDSFLMRSTAANTVEIVGGLFLVDRCLGTGQTWQDVSGSRAPATNYTNTTGRPIMVSVTRFTAGATTAIVTLSVGGVVASSGYHSGSARATLCAIVPHGAVYRVDGGESTANWAELR